MNRLELLNSRGFKDEKHLAEFLENCKDEGWKQDLIAYFGDEPKLNKKSEEVIKEVKETSKKSSKVKED